MRACVGVMWVLLNVCDGLCVCLLFFAPPLYVTHSPSELQLLRRDGVYSCGKESTLLNGDTADE